MEKILDSLKSGMIWTDNINVEANALIPVDRMEINNVISNISKASTISVMDLGKMLLSCAKEGDTAKVHELMSRGAPFTTDWLGTSPLHLAAMHNHLETCEVLLRAGISKDARTKVDRTPLHLAVYEGHEKIVELLLKSKCDVNAKDMLKMTPLHWAVEKRFSKIVSHLLKYGAEPTAISKFDKTPILLALESKQNDIFQELISHNEMIGQQEQQEATDTLISELEKDNYNQITAEDMDTDVVYSSPERSPTTNETTAFQMLGNNSVPQNHRQNASKMVDSPALQILKDHGIAMLPDDTENSLINSALQSGRKLILSDAGKLILNYPKGGKNGFSGTSPSELSLHNIIKTESAIKKKPALVMPALSPAKNATALKTNKVIKILSAEEFTKMCGAKGSNNTFKRVEGLPNGSVRLDANNVNNLNKTNKRAVMNKCKISTLPNTIKQQMPSIRLNTVPIKSVANVQRMPKLISPVVVTNNSHEHHVTASINSKPIIFSSTSPSPSSASASISSLAIDTPSTSYINIADPTNTTTNSQTVTFKSATNLNNKSSAMITIPKNGLADVMRQLFDLKKQTDDLRKQMEIYQKQNEDYRTRLEKLEKERELERNREDSTRQYTNSDY